MARKNKREDNRPAEQAPGKTEVPDIRRDDKDLLHRNSNTEEIKIGNDNRQLGGGDNDSRNDEPVEENSIRP